MSNPVLQTFLELRQGAQDAESKERASGEAALEQAMRSMRDLPSYDRIVDSLPEALEDFGIHFDDENEFHTDHLAKIAKHLDGRLKTLGDLSKSLGMLLAGAASRGHPRALRGISGHIDGLGSFEQ